MIDIQRMNLVKLVFKISKVCILLHPNRGSDGITEKRSIMATLILPCCCLKVEVGLCCPLQTTEKLTPLLPFCLCLCISTASITCLMFSPFINSKVHYSFFPALFFNNNKKIIMKRFISIQWL